MDQQFSLIAQKREVSGKGAMRRLRREGMVPAILYGTGDTPVQLKIQTHHVRKQLESEAFFSHVLTVSVDGNDTQAVLRAVQRDPATSEITHLDLLRVSSKQAITMNVPLRFVNEDTSPGKRAGGVASHHLVEVQISCLPQNLPEYIEVDLAHLELGSAVHLSELSLPKGVSMADASATDADHDQPVVSIQHSQQLDVAEEEEQGDGAEEPEGDVPSS